MPLKPKANSGKRILRGVLEYAGVCRTLDILRRESSTAFRRFESYRGINKPRPEERARADKFTQSAQA
jgi:hypothetical protein